MNNEQNMTQNIDQATQTAAEQATAAQTAAEQKLANSQFSPVEFSSGGGLAHFAVVWRRFSAWAYNRYLAVSTPKSKTPLPY